MSKANQDNIFVKIVVLVNGVPDYRDKALTRQEIKEIFANHKELNFDLEHDHNYLGGIDIVENYISKVDETVRDVTVPAGSWIMILNITNPLILAGIENGDILGSSLETDFTEDMITTSSDEVVPYSAVVTKEEMIPKTVSFTRTPANQHPLEVMTHKQYTRKSREIRGGEYMPENEEPKENKSTVETTANNLEEERNWLHDVLDKIFTNHSNGGTQKSLAVTANNMQSQPTMGAGTSSTDDLVNQLIQSQKIIPQLQQLIEALTETITVQSDAFSSLEQKVDTILLKNSTKSMEEDKEEDKETVEDRKEEANASSTSEEVVQEEPVDTSDVEETNTETTATTNTEEETTNTDEERDQNNNEEEQVETTDTTETSDTEEPEGLTSEEEQELERLTKKKNQSTKKSNNQAEAKTRTPATFGNNIDNTEDNSINKTLNYISSRTVEYFRNGGE